MILSLFNIINFRNLHHANLAFAPHFNLFFGDNAAGKTSLLEAIYYLGTGKSFRTHHHDRVIQNNEEQFTLFTQFQLENTFNQIGLQRNRNGSVDIHMNNESIRSIADISKQLPIQFIGSDSHRILSDGPKYRRQFLDWGLFHSNILFFSQWKEFQKVLTQRNAALKSRASFQELTIWNNAFSTIAESLNSSRQSYIDGFKPFFTEIMSILLPEIPITLDYSPGWDTQFSLESILSNHVSRETLVGHSLFGPHRADLLILVDKIPAQDVLSQGQQKLVSYGLHLSQGLFLQTELVKTPIYLIDDLPSELDATKRTLVIEILSRLGAQVFITGIESEDLSQIMELNANNKMFHVEHGVISEYEEIVSRETC